MARNKYPRQYTISNLELLNKRNALCIPDVQRDLVWTKSQKQLLIDSLLKDFDIPKLYFRVREENDDTYYDIIDGQQRLNTIFEFLDDRFEMPSDADDYKKESIKNKKWSEFSPELQIEFTGRALDVVLLTGYSDEEIDETFLRLQNGTPLKAAEKRRAIKGNMRYVISQLAENDIFTKYCQFKNLHYAYEDVAAKILRQIMEGKPSPVRAQDLMRMYENNSNISIEDKCVKDVLKTFRFIKRAFSKNDNPQFKKYAIMDLASIANGLLKVYDLNDYATEFGNAYLAFQNERILNADKPEDDQNPLFVSYSSCARGDSLEFIEFRQKFLREYILQQLPKLAVKDKNRNFTPDQRAVIYRLGGGVCAKCGKPVSEEDFEADHIFPWSKGGKTQIENGQILCSDCNKEKSNKLNED